MANIYADYIAPSNEGGLFLKLEEGKSVKLRLVSEPYIFTNDFRGQISNRYAWVVLNRDENKAQIFQQSVTGYKQIANLATDEDWGDPAAYDIRVTREGSGTDTKYHFSPSPQKGPLSAEDEQLVAKVDLQTAIKNAIPLSQVVDGKPVPAPLSASTTQPNEPGDVVIEDLDPSEPINLSDIPF